MLELDRQSKPLIGKMRELTSIDAVSGQEGHLGRFLEMKVREANVRVVIGRDNFGNLFARIPGKMEQSRRTLMICAHIDEIGCAVKRIEPEGFLRLHKVGSPNVKLLPGRLVKVEGVVGVIGVKSWHQSSPEERKRMVPLEELYVDMGVSSADQVRELGITIGSRVTFLSELTQVGSATRFAGKAIDDRVGCLILLELLKNLREPIDWDVVCVFSVQEEVGLRGAAAAAYTIKPDAAIAIDNTFAEDTPDYPRLTPETVTLGNGPVLHVMEFTDELYRGIISHPAVVAKMIAAAKVAKTPYQTGYHIHGMTDATAVHLTRGGIPTCSMGIPSRYTHSPVEMFDFRDVGASISLLLEFAKALGPDDEFGLPC